MKTLLFATGNDRKFKEALAGCDGFDIKVEQVKVDIDEIQSHDPIKISLNKVKSVYEILKKPVVISDTSWKIPALNNFPGGYMKDVAEWFTPEDFLNLVKYKDDKRVCFTETLVYQDEKETKIFTKEFWGTFSDTPKGSGLSIEQVAQFNGSTIGERRDEGKLSHDPKDYIWIELAKWFSDYK